MLFPLPKSLRPFDAASALADEPHLVFLDSSQEDHTLSQWSYVMADPCHVFQVEKGLGFIDGRVASDQPLEALQAFLKIAEDYLPADLPCPFQGGAAGYLAYEFGRYTETFPHLASHEDMPDAWLGFYDLIAAFNIKSGQAFAFVRQRKEEAETAAQERLEAFVAKLTSPAVCKKQTPLEQVDDWHTSMSRREFERQVEHLRHRIFNGDVFQANLSRQIFAERPTDFDALGFYGKLRQENPAPFSAYLDCGVLQICCSSPERFLQMSKNKVEARPIKGTIKRNEKDSAADEKAKSALRASQKDYSENVMIVDLLRNDLSKVAKPFSVQVPSLCAIETFANLHHLVSVVTAEMEEGNDVVDLIAATFPGGSITGAPKVKAMELIAEAEKAPRGVYCGSIGWFGMNGDLDLNIVIRTVIATEKELSIGLGSGITWGSGPTEEFRETELKGEKLQRAFLAETEEDA